MNIGWSTRPHDRQHARTFCGCGAQRSGDGSQPLPRDRVAARDVNATSALLLDGVSDEKEDWIATLDMEGGNRRVIVRRMQDDMRQLQAFNIAVTLVVAHLLFGGVLFTAPVFH